MRHNRNKDYSNKDQNYPNNRAYNKFSHESDSPSKYNSTYHYNNDETICLRYRKNPEYKKHSNHNDNFPLHNKKINKNTPKSTECIKMEISKPEFTNLRERLTEELNNESCECLICCSAIKRTARIWNCSMCYNVYHISCIKEWASASIKDGSWTCPSCKYTHTIIPTTYRCFCGRMKDPLGNDYSITAHSCGDICKRSGLCRHKCVNICHPGACPQCTVSVEQYCHCGNARKFDRCRGFTEFFSCGEKVCGKQLACGDHYCREICHSGDCGDCEEEIDINCYCKKEDRRIKCHDKKSRKFNCKAICSRDLSCGIHTCKELCHSSNCKTCLLHIENLSTCACGRTPISLLFSKTFGVLDSYPICDKICGKKLNCAQFDISGHFCPLKCHAGVCPDYCEDGTVNIFCNCKKTPYKLSCSEAFERYTNNDPKRCDTCCNTRKLCKRHICHEKCCILKFHYCSLLCSRLLTCKDHTCEETCHSGKCKPCPKLITDELSCHCGGSVIFPPSACGTTPPVCNLPCNRPQECIQHPVNHDCHESEDCPPCNARITATCYGGHKKLDSILCYIKAFSCGDKCGKQLKCAHTCQLTCHKGQCSTNGCKQPCTAKRMDCPHICGVPCNDHSECCKEPCVKMVGIHCECQVRTEKIPCHEALSLRIIECDDNCIKQRRVNALMEGLGCVDLTFEYSFSDTFLQTAKQNVNFIKNIERTLSDLIGRLHKETEMSVAYDFPSMSYDKCCMIEKMAEYYGCEAQMYDSEPHLNATVIAHRGRSVVPSKLVSNVCRIRDLTPID